MVRALLGLLKGALLGAGVGFGAFHLGLGGGWGYLVYGGIGFLVGLLVGRPIWSHAADRESTVWTSVLKGIVGIGVGIGLYAIARFAVGDPAFALAGETRPLTGWTYLFGGAVGALYGAFVEADDAPAKKKPVKEDKEAKER
jgi:hypothetical protein